MMTEDIVIPAEDILSVSGGIEDYRVVETVRYRVSGGVRKRKSLPTRYIINENAVILFWDDGSKTIVKRGRNEPNDPIKGFLWAYFQKNSGMSKTKANKYLSELVKNVR